MALAAKIALSIFGTIYIYIYIQTFIACPFFKYPASRKTKYELLHILPQLHFNQHLHIYLYICMYMNSKYVEYQVVEYQVKAHFQDLCFHAVGPALRRLRGDVILSSITKVRQFSAAFGLAADFGLNNPSIDLGHLHNSLGLYVCVCCAKHRETAAGS